MKNHNMTTIFVPSKPAISRSEKARIGALDQSASPSTNGSTKLSMCEINHVKKFTFFQYYNNYLYNAPTGPPPPVISIHPYKKSNFVPIG
jgi:hypothetical protein